MTFSIKCKDGELIRSSIKNKKTDIDKDMYNVSSVTVWGNKELATELLSKQLNEKGMVIFRTVDKMLPASKYYDASFCNMQEFPESGHVMLMVGEDEQNYYFVDQLSEINKDLAVATDARKDIFKWDKLKMQSLFEIYLKLTLVEFNNIDEDELIKKSELIIEESVNDFFANSSRVKTNDNGIITLRNMEAISWLRAFCNSSNKLNTQVYRYPQGIRTTTMVYDEIVNGITGIVNNRRLLYIFLEKNDGKSKELLQCLEKNIYGWDNLKRYLMINYKKKEFDLDGRYDACFKSVVDTEAELFNELRNRVSKKHLV